VAFPSRLHCESDHKVTSKYIALILPVTRVCQIESASRHNTDRESTVVDGAAAGGCAGGSRWRPIAETSNARIRSVQLHPRLRLPPSRKSKLSAANNEKS
jgi:hypothetical protein